MSLIELLLLGLAAVAAGAVNALAGGGSILTFPALVAAGLPPLAANITNSVALCPGYVGGVFAQRHDLKGQARRVLLLTPVAIAGGLGGALLILNSSEALFRSLVPWLLLGGCALLAVQDRLRAWLQQRTGSVGLGWAMLPVGLGAVYGGYFGAGLGVIFLAVLGLAIDDGLIRLNALKQTLSLGTNVSAAALLVLSPQMVWSAGFIMGAGAIVGGIIGGRAAGRIRPDLLRATVIVIGVAVALVFLVRG